MRLLALLRLPLRLFALPLLALMLAFPASGPASAEPNPPTAGTETAPAGAETQPDPANPANPETDPNAESGEIQQDPDSALTDPDAASTEPESKVLVTVDKSMQQMTVWVDGVEQYTWPVSTGRPGYSTPSGTYTASSMNEIWYSKQWDSAPMPHAIFFTKKGHAIHGSTDTKHLGKPASHGCVRLSPENASILYALVEEKGLKNTEVVLSGETPGGESVVASPGARPWGPGQAAPWVYPGYEYYGQRPQRYGRRGRWRDPYYGGPPGYAGPQGYYQPRGFFQPRRNWYPGN